MNDLLRSAFTIDDELDDIRRAHAWSKLEARLAMAPAPAPAKARWPFAVAAVAAAAIVTAVLPRRSAPTFVAPADTRLSLHVDDATRAVLVGPAELEPVAHTPTTTIVRLRRGTFIGEFAGGHGRSLKILAPGAEIEIVGTLFSIEALDASTCVSVSHGTVKLSSAGRVQFVTTGQRACSDEIIASAIAPAMREELARHATPAVIAPKPIVTPIITPIIVPPPPPPAAPAVVVAPAKPPNEEQLYAAAERALAVRDPVAADRALAKLVELPGSRLLDQAYYERARIAYDRGAFADARADLDKLAQLADTPLVEPGAYLRCRVAIAAAEHGAEGCFTSYRARFPHSPHDRDALTSIVELTFAAGGCAAAKPHIDELASRYATSWSATCR